MNAHLPPLNALRAFEAAARHLSFTKAAHELSVTPAAVSQQVRSLESHLGVTLFRRRNRSLLLTDAAQACLPFMREGFDRLAEGVDRLRSANTGGVLAVSVAPSFASKWLVPRLGRFSQAHPDIEVWVSSSMELVDFNRDDVDLAIRYGTGRYPGVKVERLLSEYVFPVCSPKLLEGAQPLRTPDDLCNYPLLHDDSPDDDDSCPDWTMWLKAAAVSCVDAARGPRFNQSSLVLEAAASGRGVALAKSALASGDIAEGRLVKPFETTLPIDFAYYMLCPESKLTLPKVATFRAWLIEMARAEAGDSSQPVAAE